jgi:opacity protein-like surface antigen
MRHRCLLAVLSLAVVPAALSAQRPIKLGIAGGVSVPRADLSDDGLSWHALATVALSTLMQPIGLRLDVAHWQSTQPEGLARRNTLSSGTLNVTYRLPMTDSPMSPYVITGLGLYRTDCSLPACEASNHFGWNAGGGTKINVLGLLTFVEARYHSANAGAGRVAHVPITIGLMF